MVEGSGDQVKDSDGSLFSLGSGVRFDLVSLLGRQMPQNHLHSQGPGNPVPEESEEAQRSDLGLLGRIGSSPVGCSFGSWYQVGGAGDEGTSKPSPESTDDGVRDRLLANDRMSVLQWKVQGLQGGDLRSSARAMYPCPGSNEVGHLWLVQNSLIRRRSGSSG